MNWYYFTRSGANLCDLGGPVQGGRIPPRPSDANPDNGDPLTPWYRDEDHLDHEHVHVRAPSIEEARTKALDLINPERVRKWTLT